MTELVCSIQVGEECSQFCFHIGLQLVMCLLQVLIVIYFILTSVLSSCPKICKCCETPKQRYSRHSSATVKQGNTDSEFGNFVGCPEMISGEKYPSKGWGTCSGNLLQDEVSMETSNTSWLCLSRKCLEQLFLWSYLTLQYRDTQPVFSF